MHGSPGPLPGGQGPTNGEEIGAESAVDVAEALALGVLVGGDRGQRRVAVEVVIEPERPADALGRLRIVAHFTVPS